MTRAMNRHEIASIYALALMRLVPGAGYHPEKANIRPSATQIEPPGN